MNNLLKISNTIKIDGIYFDLNNKFVNNDIYRFYHGFERTKYQKFDRCTKIVLTDYSKITSVNCQNKINNHTVWTYIKVSPEILENLIKNPKHISYFLKNFSHFNKGIEIVFIPSKRKTTGKKTINNKFEITVKKGYSTTFDQLNYSIRSLEKNYNKNSVPVLFVEQKIIRNIDFSNSIDFLFEFQMSTPSNDQLEYLQNKNKNMLTQETYEEWKNFPYLSIWYYLQHDQNRKYSILDSIKYRGRFEQGIKEKNPLIQMLRNIAIENRDNTYGATSPKPLSDEYQLKAKENILKYSRQQFIKEWGEDFVDKFYKFDNILKSCMWS